MSLGANGVSGNVECRRHHIVDRHSTTLGLLLSAIARAVRTMRAQRSAAVRIFCAAAWVAGVSLLFEQYGPRHNHGKRIVELVRDAGQERSEGRKLSRWYKDSRCRASSSADRFFSVMS